MSETKHPTCPTCGRVKWNGVRVLDVDYDDPRHTYCTTQGGPCCRLVVRGNNLYASLKRVLTMLDEDNKGYRSPEQQMQLRTARAILEENK